MIPVSILLGFFFTQDHHLGIINSGTSDADDVEAKWSLGSVVFIAYRVIIFCNLPG